MNRILRLYVIREVALPTFLTLMTIIFILIMGQVYRLITFLMQPSVTFIQVADALLSFIPQLMVMAVPMALLIGVLIGVGRMTLDREMLASRASGINLLSMFAPMILLGGLVSLGMMRLNREMIPDLFQRGLNRISEMQYALVTSLEPGQFHGAESLGKTTGDAQFEMYFKERDPQDPNTMKGITIKLEEDTDLAQREKKVQKQLEKAVAKAKDGDTSAAAALVAAAAASPGAASPAGPSSVSPLAGIVSSSTLAGAGSGAGVAALAASGGGTASAGLPSTFRRNQLTLITAQRGTIGEAPLEQNRQDRQSNTQRSAIVLKLANGTIHRLNADAADRQYMVIRFDKLEKRLFGSGEIEKWQKVANNKELSKIVADKKRPKRDRGLARKELAQRFAISLASFVFVLIGIPLAIWVRPSGKSWGILLAVGLMLVYYLLMQWGLGLVEYDRPFGYTLTFSPTLLFLVLGGGLWWQSVRS